MSIKKKLQSTVLNIKQKHINHKYAKEGLTDDVLRKQVKLNIKRNELDIADKSNVDGEYVQ